jgi:hypothetical protein
MTPSALRAATVATVAVLSVAQSCSSPVVAGQVTALVDGIATPLAVLTEAPAGFKVDATGVALAHNYRGYLVRGCPSQFSADAYAQPLVLLGRNLNYTVELSTVGCGCNAAFYFSAMPGYNASGLPEPGSGDYYCDANKGNGVWCPEMDTMEANTAALQITPHRCDAPTGRYYPSCDRGGCAVNSYKVDPGAYGAGPSFKVDTTRPFNVSTSFRPGPDGILASITTVLSQGAASFVLSHTDAACGAAGYLEALSPALAAGMTPIFSLWGDAGSTMKWLDVPPCDEGTACAAAGARMRISAISLAKL